MGWLPGQAAEAAKAQSRVRAEVAEGLLGSLQTLMRDGEATVPQIRLLERTATGTLVERGAGVLVMTAREFRFLSDQKQTVWKLGHITDISGGPYVMIRTDNRQALFGVVTADETSEALSYAVRCAHEWALSGQRPALIDDLAELAAGQVDPSS